MYRVGNPRADLFRSMYESQRAGPWLVNLHSGGSLPPTTTTITTYTMRLSVINGFCFCFSSDCAPVRPLQQSGRLDPKVWTEEDKALLAEAIDMYGVSDPKRLTARVPTKKLHHVLQMLRDLRTRYRKDAECLDMQRLPFVDLNVMDDLFVVGGTRPREVMVKWMEYLEEFYGKDPYQYDKFKLFSRAFLVMSECMPPSTAMMRVTTTPVNGGNPQSRDDLIDFRKVYYFLYRVFNNYCVPRNYKDPVMKNYLYETFMRVLEDIEYSSNDEKIAMHNIVFNWTSVNRVKSLRVYGKVPKVEPGTNNENNTNEDNSNLRKVAFNVLEQPMIPSFNPLRIKSCHLKTET